MVIAKIEQVVTISSGSCLRKTGMIKERPKITPGRIIGSGPFSEIYPFST
jgi:hypothetical protein